MIGELPEETGPSAADAPRDQRAHVQAAPRARSKTASAVRNVSSACWIRELVRLVVSFRASANNSDRWLTMRNFSNPINTAQAAATSPTIPHVARNWVEPFSNFTRFDGAFGANMIVAALEPKIVRRSEGSVQRLISTAIRNRAIVPRVRRRRVSAPKIGNRAGRWHVFDTRRCNGEGIRSISAQEVEKRRSFLAGRDPACRSPSDRFIKHDVHNFGV